jgi:hypothetical protein
MGTQYAPVDAQVIEPVKIQSEVPDFFNRKVVKPVKGGGKGVPTVDPYSSSNKKGYG